MFGFLFHQNGHDSVYESNLQPGAISFFYRFLRGLRCDKESKFSSLIPGKCWHLLYIRMLSIERQYYLKGSDEWEKPYNLDFIF